MNRIREYRKKKKLTLKQLSEELAKNDFKISADALGKYERDDREPKLETWIKLADFFDVSVPYLQGISRNSENLPNKQKYTIDDIISLIFDATKVMYGRAGYERRYDVIPKIPLTPRPRYGSPFNFTERYCFYDTADMLRKMPDNVSPIETLRNIADTVQAEYLSSNSLNRVASRKDIDELVLRFYDAVREKYLQCIDNKFFINMVNDDLSLFVIEQAKANIFGTTDSINENKRVVNPENLDKLPKKLDAKIYKKTMDILKEAKKKIRNLAD